MFQVAANLKRQLLVFIFLVSLSSVRSTPIESNHPSRRPGDLPGTHRQAAPPVPCPAAPLSGGLLPPDSHPPGPDNLLPPAPVGAISICKGFWYCGSNGKLVSQHAIDGWKNFVFYRPGTAVVASYDDNARITILHCPSGYSGPGLIGKQIKDTLQFVLDRCPSKACGRFVVEKHYLFFYILWLKT